MVDWLNPLSSNKYWMEVEVWSHLTETTTSKVVKERHQIIPIGALTSSDGMPHRPYAEIRIRTSSKPSAQL